MARAKPGPDGGGAVPANEGYRKVFLWNTFELQVQLSQRVFDFGEEEERAEGVRRFLDFFKRSHSCFLHRFLIVFSVFLKSFSGYPKQFQVFPRTHEGGLTLFVKFHFSSSITF